MRPPVTTHRSTTRALRSTLLAVALLGAAACEPGEKETVQTGYRGLGMASVYDQSQLQTSLAANVAPAPLPPAGESPPGNWQNVQVLTDVNAAEMTRTMAAMTQWVSPEQGCVYCHNPRNFAADTLDDGSEIYAKIVSRQMLRMTRDLNSNYRTHTGQQGVTCYSCHRGQPVPPAGLWTFTDENQHLRWLLDRDDARVQSYTVGPSERNRSSIKQTENTYALMISMSEALGVNCTYCHNSRSWAEWQNAPPTRIVAQQGLRMVRGINTEYITPLNQVLPATRLGSLGDAPKVQCVTCHQGAARPLYGAMLAQYYPALWGHPGPWNVRRAGDTTLAGVRDYRLPTGLPPEYAPLLGPIAPRSRPVGYTAPVGSGVFAPPVPLPTGTDTVTPAGPVNLDSAGITGPLPNAGIGPTGGAAQGGAPPSPPPR